MKNFVKAMKQNQNDFLYLKEKFPRISETKMNEGIFVGPQIKDIMNDNIIDDMLKELESTWIAFKSVANNFLGNLKADDFSMNS